MNLAAALENRVSHILDNSRKFVRSDMRMRIDKDRRACAVLTEDIQNLVDVSSLLASCIEFSVGIRSCPSLAKTVVALAVNLVFARDSGDIVLAVANVLSALNHDRTKSKFYKTKRGEQSAGTCANNQDLRLAFDISVLGAHKLIVLRLLVNVGTNLKINHHGALTGIDTAFQHTHRRQCANVESLLVRNEILNSLFVYRILRQHSILKFLYHKKYK